MRLSFLFLAFLISQGLLSQDLKIGDFKSLPSDISGREQAVVDVNGEPCALIKVRTGLNNVTFFSNLSIEKVEHYVSEYWVWVSPGTTQLRIAVQDFPLLDYKLPKVAEGNNVYAILLIATFPEKIIYRDTAGIQPHVSIITDPVDADVFINEIFYGRTPLKVNIADSIFNYRIEKKRYLPVIGSDTIFDKIVSISEELVPDTKARRYFFSLKYGINSYAIRDNNSTTRYNQLLGLTFGRVGKTGYFLSTAISRRSISPDFEYIRVSDTQIPRSNTAGYYYFIDRPTVMSERDQFNLFRISGGLTQQISRRSFMFFGTGYSQRIFYKSFIKEPYEVNYSGASQSAPLSSGYAYGLILDESYRGFNIDLGLSHVFKSSLFFSVDYTINFKLGCLADSKKYNGLYQNANINLTDDVGLLYPDIKFGLGYLF